MKLSNGASIEVGVLMIYVFESRGILFPVRYVILHAPVVRTCRNRVDTHEIMELVNKKGYTSGVQALDDKHSARE